MFIREYSMHINVIDMYFSVQVLLADGKYRTRPLCWPIAKLEVEEEKSTTDTEEPEPTNSTPSTCQWHDIYYVSTLAPIFCLDYINNY